MNENTLTLYRVLQDFGDLKVGEEVELDWTPEQIQEHINGGTIELVTPNTPVIPEDAPETINEDRQSEDVVVPETPATPQGFSEIPQRYFKGRSVVFDGMRTVNEREMHHVKLDDGTTVDLTDKEYADMVEASEKK